MSLASPAQIRAARALLKWSMVDLAEAARVSVSTIKRFEDGRGAPYSVGVMQDALAKQGVQFLADDGFGAGVRFKPR